jgi:hypothetical protein
MSEYIYTINNFLLFFNFGQYNQLLTMLTIAQEIVQISPFNKQVPFFLRIVSVYISYISRITMYQKKHLLFC